MNKAFRIVFTGPESTGKTTLSRELALHYSAPYVGEYARMYLDQLNRPYKEADLRHIAEQQVEASLQEKHPETPLIFIDTHLLVIKVWSDYKYGRCDPWILEQLKTHSFDLFFLCKPDIPWESGPQRENPSDREALYQIYKRELLNYQWPFVELGGSFSERKSKAVAIINGLLMQSSV